MERLIKKDFRWEVFFYFRSNITYVIRGCDSMKNRVSVRANSHSLSFMLHLADRNQIHAKLSHDHTHQRIIVDLLHDPAGLMLIIAHHHLICQRKVLHSKEESCDHIRSERRMWNIE